MAVIAVLLPSIARAHEIPSDVVIRMFLRAQGGTAIILVRAPLQAMRDFDFPQDEAGYLDVPAAMPMVRAAARLWIADAITLYSGDTKLPAPRLVQTRISAPSDRSFGTYEGALAHLRAAAPATPEGSGLAWEHALIDVQLEIPVGTPEAPLSLATELPRLGQRTATVLLFQTEGGSERALEFVGDPGLIRLDPRWHQAAWRFIKLGVSHILGGLDHLLFLLCLVVPCRRVRPLIGIVSAFTVSHSITLVASAAGFAPAALWFPPLIETLIAVSILYMALENIVGPRLQRRWMIAFAFGLVHGFGFSFALRQTLQFAGTHLLTSLLAFNLGVELGQLLVVAVAVPLLAFVFRYLLQERIGTIVISALLAHTGWHWTSERFADLRQYQISLPAFDLLLLAALLRWLMLALVVAAAGWLLAAALRRLRLLRVEPLPTRDRSHGSG